MTTHEQVRKEPPMSDEQRMREQFEAHYKGLYPDTHMGRDAQGDYTNGLVLLQWEMWQAAWQARDAEVQALREAVLELIECAEEASDRLKPPSGSLDFAIWNARRALAGGETGETE